MKLKNFQLAAIQLVLLALFLLSFTKSCSGNKRTVLKSALVNPKYRQEIKQFSHGQLLNELCSSSGGDISKCLNHLEFLIESMAILLKLFVQSFNNSGFDAFSTEVLGDDGAIGSP